ncbi:MAG TPA: hypothetical protein VFA65_12245 [Bryobacteraceae bacterium]|nr:hypothetical protein [Bryobacteraceae bacterium]
MQTPLADFLVQELGLAGFAPDPLLIKLVASRMADRGANEFQNLRGRLGEVEHLRCKCMYHLGVGASLTEFLVAGLPLSRDARREVASLGGIAHTIYAVFDTLLDTSGSVPELFGEQTRLSGDPEIRSQQQLVLDLVKLYFAKLNSLPELNGRIQVMTARAIERLYRAELHSAQPGDVTFSTWWRKNALPIVIMGLPGWISASGKSTISFTEHLLWLGRVGEFFGWVDDFSDYEKDRASGQANRLKLMEKTSLRSFARNTATKGKRILRLWESRNDDPATRNTFTVVVWTSLVPPTATTQYRVPEAEAGVSGLSHSQ